MFDLKFPITVELDGDDYIVTKVNFKDFLDIYLKDEFDDYKDYMRSEWDDHKEEYGSDALPFLMWHEEEHDFKLKFIDWLEHEFTKEQILEKLKEYVDDNREDWDGDD